MSKRQSQRGISVLFVLVVLVLLGLIGGGGYVLWNQYQETLKPSAPETGEKRELPIEIAQKASSSPTSKPKGTPSPILQGKETYTISLSESEHPKIYRAEIDPHDPKPGETQKITVSVSDGTPVKAVTISVASDNKKTDLPPAKLVEGTNLDGKWETSWTVNDTVLYTYVIGIKTQGTSANSDFNISIR